MALPGHKKEANCHDVVSKDSLSSVYRESTVGAQKQVSSADPGAMRNGLSRDTR